MDIDIEAGIAAWDGRSFDGTWSNSGVEVPELGVMRSLAWWELYERERLNSRSLGERARVVDDIDRCEHGRHHGDGCAGCAGPSLGNPLLRNGPVTLAYNMAGEAHVASQDLGYLRSTVEVSA